MSDEDPPATVNNHKNCKLATVHTNAISAIPSTVEVSAGKRRKSVAIIFVIIAIVLIIATVITLPIVLVDRNPKVKSEEAPLTTKTTASTTRKKTTTRFAATTRESNRYNIMFTEQKSYSTGNRALPVALAVVDVNKDKKPDIIVVNEDASIVNVFSNMGDETFSLILNIGIGENFHPQFVSVVDVNRDDLPDITVAINYASIVGVLFNLGTGTFAVGGSYTTRPTTNLLSLTVADFNGDKKPDIIVTNQNENIISVLYNLGNGTFPTQKNYQLPDGTGPTSPSVVDINGDNRPDIIFASSDGNAINIVFNHGENEFNVRDLPTGSGSQPVFLSVVDVNQDDKLDIVVANNNTHNVGVFLHSDNGTFLPQMIYSTGNNSNPHCVSVVDINGDNLPDIIVANHNDNNIGILVNIGNGKFILEKILSTGPYSAPRFVSVVDVNGDAKPDIIVANSNTSSIGVMLAS